MKHLARHCLLIGLLSCTVAHAQVEQVADIHPGIQGSDPQYMTMYGKKLVFQAFEASIGTELWEYDGKSVSLVANIHPTASGSDPSQFTLFDNILVFSAQDVSGNAEPWLYNGQAVTKITELRPGSRGSHPNNFTVFKDALYFTAVDGETGREIWKYDGSTVSQVADLWPGKQGSEPDDLTVFGDQLMFTALDSINARELWSYDGSQFTQVTDSFSVHFGAHPDQLTVWQNQLLFVGLNRAAPPTGAELWVYDSTGVHLVADIIPGNSPAVIRSLMPTTEGVFFTARDPNLVRRLFRYDGDTVQQLDSTVILEMENEFVMLHDELIFPATSGTDNTELYHHANGEVTLLAEFANGAQGSDPQQLVVFRDAVYLSVKDLFNDWSWWQYTGGSFFRVKSDFYAGSGIAFNKQLVFVTNTDSTGTELWRWDPRPPVSADHLEVSSTAFSIFPNPTPGVFQLASSTPLEHGAMTVMDIMGRPVHQQPLSRQTRWPLTVDLTGQPAGTYVVLIRTDDRVISHRLVLAR